MSKQEQLENENDRLRCKVEERDVSDKKYAWQVEFSLVQKIVFSLISVIVLGVIVALINSVINK